MLTGARVVLRANLGRGLKPKCSCSYLRAIAKDAQNVGAWVQIFKSLDDSCNQQQQGLYTQRGGGLTCTANDGAVESKPAAKELDDTSTSAAGAPSTCNEHRRGCARKAARSSGTAATSVLAASRQLQDVTAVSETPSNIDGKRALSAATTSALRRSNAES